MCLQTCFNRYLFCFNPANNNIKTFAAVKRSPGYLLFSCLEDKSNTTLYRACQIRMFGIML